MKLNYFEDDCRIVVDGRLKNWIISVMLGFHIDLEKKNEYNKRDGIFDLDNKSIEFKNGKKIGNKLPLEIYTDLNKKKPGCLSKANADYIVFVKKYAYERNTFDIFVMDYKKLVRWWWEEGTYKRYEPFQRKQKTIDLYGFTWISTHYNFIIDKIPPHIILDQRRYFDASFIFRQMTLQDWSKGCN